MQKKIVNILEMDFNNKLSNITLIKIRLNKMIKYWLNKMKIY